MMTRRDVGETQKIWDQGKKALHKSGLVLFVSIATVCCHSRGQCDARYPRMGAVITVVTDAKVIMGFQIPDCYCWYYWIMGLRYNRPVTP